jgi:AcrR family transcriptional regulator
VDARVERGVTVKEACAEAGLTESTYYRWRATMHAEEGREAPMRRDIARARSSIEDAAKTVFLGVGYSASIVEIAEAANVSRQTIYNVYGDKAAVFRSIVGRLYETCTSSPTWRA